MDFWGDEEGDNNRWILLYSSLLIAGFGIGAYNYQQQQQEKQKNMFKVPSLAGKVAVITGANTGIGAATAYELAKAGANVIISCRSLERGNAKAQEIKSSFNTSSKSTGNVIVHELDVSCPKSIASFASKVPDRVHILVNNAGALIPERQLVNGDVELTVMTNHLGPAMLTRLLLPKLIKTAVSDGSEARIINVSSRLEKTAKVDHGDASAIVSQGPPTTGHYTVWKAYSISKLCMTAYTMELSRRLPTSQVVCNAVTPGMVNTDLGRIAPLWLQYLSWPLRHFLLRTPEQGAESVLYAATSPDMRGISGVFIGDCKEIKPSKLASDPQFSRQVYEETERVIDDLSRLGSYNHVNPSGQKEEGKSWYGRSLH